MLVPTKTKFIGISSSVDTLERKSALANSPSQVYTIEDIAESARLYKSYTALLTQSGGDDPQTISSGALTAGVTYEFGGVSEQGNWDFSNVGGPVYPKEYTFVATASEEPNNWEGVSALNYNTGAPVVTVLENTIGNIVWKYDGDGYSIGISTDGLFVLNKSWFVINGNQDGTDDFRYVMTDAGDNNNVYINTFKINSSGVKTYSSNMLLNTPIEIRVYN